MQREKIYTVEQAWTAMLIFFDYLAKNASERFGKSQGWVGWLFFRLHTDSECFEEWEMVYEKKRLYSLDLYKEGLTKMQVIELMEGYVFYYQHGLGLEVAALFEIIQNFVRISTENNSDFVAWEDALSRSIEGESWKLQPPERLLEFCGDLQISSEVAMLAKKKFFDSLRSEFSRFPEESLNRFLNFVCSPFYSVQWEEYYRGLMKKPYPSHKISSYEIFCTLVAFSAERSYRYGYNVYEIMRMLYGMQSKPREYIGNWELWRRICEKMM